MTLHNISDADKIKAFDMIVDAYAKDGGLSDFGRNVQEILMFLKEMFKFRG